jgi:hypothetical protein
LFSSRKYTPAPRTGGEENCEQMREGGEDFEDLVWLGNNVSRGYPGTRVKQSVLAVRTNSGDSNCNSEHSK